MSTQKVGGVYLLKATLSATLAFTPKHSYSKSSVSSLTAHPTGNLEELLAINNTCLTSILTQGCITICLYRASLTTLPGTLHVTADDLMLCFFLHWMLSNLEYGCLYSFWLCTSPLTQDSTLLLVALLCAALASFPSHSSYSQSELI
jgi:hypothetical protein